MSRKARGRRRIDDLVAVMPSFLRWRRRPPSGGVAISHSIDCGMPPSAAAKIAPCPHAPEPNSTMTARLPESRRRDRGPLRHGSVAGDDEPGAVLRIDRPVLDRSPRFPQRIGGGELQGVAHIVGKAPREFPEIAEDERRLLAPKDRVPAWPTYIDGSQTTRNPCSRARDKIDIFEIAAIVAA